MSSKKIFNTIGLDGTVWECVKLEAIKHERSRSFVIEKILERYFEMTKERHADQT